MAVELETMAACLVHRIKPFYKFFFFVHTREFPDTLLTLFGCLFLDEFLTIKPRKAHCSPFYEKGSPNSSMKRRLECWFKILTQALNLSAGLRGWAFSFLWGRFSSYLLEFRAYFCLCSRITPGSIWGTGTRVQARSEEGTCILFPSLCEFISHIPFSSTPPSSHRGVWTHLGSNSMWYINRGEDRAVGVLIRLSLLCVGGDLGKCLEISFFPPEPLNRPFFPVSLVGPQARGPLLEMMVPVEVALRRRKPLTLGAYRPGSLYMPAPSPKTVTIPERFG